MNEIKKRVSTARRRLWLIQFGRNLIWASIVCFVLTMIALVVPRIWAIESLAGADQIWTFGWLIGASCLAFLCAMMVTVARGPRQIDAAMELDSRFKLKERLSSALVLNESQLGTPAGKALLTDAERRAETLAVSEKFGFHLNRLALIPIALLLVSIGLCFIESASSKLAARETEKKELERKVVQNSIEQTKKKLTSRMKQFEQKGLKEMKPMVESIEKKLDKIQRTDVSKKDALVELNDIQKQIAEKQKELGDVKKLKKQLQKLSVPNDGVTKEFSDAMNKGDFDKAKAALSKLAEKIEKNNLSEKQQKQLAKDLNEMAKALNKMAQQQQQKKEDLKRQIQQANAKGDMNKAAQLQQQLDKMNQQDQQQQQMQQLAKNLQQCSNCMNSGKQGKQGQSKQGKQGQQGQNGGQQGQLTQQQIQDAKDAMEQLGEQLSQMQADSQQMQALEQLSDQMSECKGMCQGEVPGQGMGDKPSFRDYAKGRGKGGGKRDKSETDTGFYKSQVDAKVKKGETVVTGVADGPNRAGVTRAQARTLVEKGMAKDADPLENQNLPKYSEKQVQEYFSKMRGENFSSDKSSGNSDANKK